MTSTIKLVKASHAAAHAQRTLKEIRDVAYVLTEMDSACRGYVITSNEHYLESFEAAYKKLDNEIEDIRTAFAQNDQKNDRLKKLEVLIAHKRSLLKQSIDVEKKDHGNSAAQISFTEKGNDLMVSIISLITAFDEEGNSILKQKNISAENASAKTKYIIIALGIFSFGFILFEALIILRDIREREQTAHERERLIDELRDSITSVKVLSGLLPICASCKKIRDDKGYWNQIEVYMRDHSIAHFTHGICPECAIKLYPELYKEKPSEISGKADKL
ncbi:MAG: CHASE3 domain-containing protein [Pseudomonadota bacterium]